MIPGRTHMSPRFPPCKSRQNVTPSSKKVGETDAAGRELGIKLVVGEVLGYKPRPGKPSSVQGMIGSQLTSKLVGDGEGPRETVGLTVGISL
jgi:hypothetical protein